MNYKGQFTSLNGTLYTVSIVDVTSDDATETPITLGSTPFVMQDTIDDEPMQPIRDNTAKLTIMCKYSDIIVASSNTQYRVVLSTANGIVWAGWMQTSNVSQAWDSIEQEITYNLSSDLTATKYFDVVTSRTTIGETLRSYIWDALSHMVRNDEEKAMKVYIGNSMPMLNSTHTLLSANSTLSRWVEQETNDDGNVEDVCSTVHDVLEAFATLCGLTISTDGASIYIGSDDDTQYKVLKRSDFMSEAALKVGLVTSWHDIDSATSEDVDFAGEQEYNKLQQAHKISFTSGGDEFDNAIPELTASNCKVDKFSEIPTGKVDVYDNWVAVHYISKKGTGVHMYRRDYDSEEGFGDVLDETNPVIADASDTNILGKALGAVLLKQDYWRSSATEAKFNYEMNESIFIQQSYLYQDSSGNQCIRRMSGKKEGPFNTLAEAESELSGLPYFTKGLVVLENLNGVGINKGGFCISFNAAIERKTDDGAKDFGPVCYGYSGMRTGNLKAKCIFSVGGYSWNGSEFVEGTGHTFEIALDHDTVDGTPKVIVNTKVLSELYTCTGYSMKVDKYLAGSCSFMLLGIYNLEAGEESGKYYAYLDIPDRAILNSLKVEYCKALDADLSDSEPTYSKDKTFEGGTDERSVETVICTDMGLADNDGMLFYNDERVGDVTVGETTDKVENITVARLASTNKTREAVVLDVKSNSKQAPIFKLNLLEKDYLFGGIKERDYRNDETNVRYIHNL